MKTKLLQTITDLFFITVCLAIVIIHLSQSSLPLAKTARVTDPISSNKAVLSVAELTLAGPAQPPVAGAVVPFVKALHIHGIPYEQARQFGPEAGPILLELLTRPENARYATNIVVTLGFMGYPEARQPLLDYLTQTSGEVSLNTFRGLTAVPYALGQLAHQGDTAALTFLLQAVDKSYWSQQTLPWTYRGQTYSLELYQQSLLGLGISGRPEALARLEAVINQAPLSSQAEGEVLQQALELNRRVQQDGMAPVVTSDPAQPPADLLDAVGVLAEDTNLHSHLQTFTVARHVSETGLTSNDQVDAILLRASEIMQAADSPGDISCCIALQRRNPLGVFAVTDGMVTTSSELKAVFDLDSHQVKVVPTLDYCGGANPSIIGCAFIGSPKNMVLEYLDDLTLDGILWAHEFGHNQGLFHPMGDQPIRIMNGKLDADGIGRQMTQTECNAWHKFNPVTVIGPCPLLFTVEKTLVTTAIITSGSRITYTLTLRNNTFNPVSHITIRDSLPISTTYLAGSAVAHPALVDLTDFPTGTLPFTLSRLSSLVITYTTQVGLVHDKEKLINTAIITTPSLPQPLQASYTAIVGPFRAYLPLIFKNDK